MTITVEGVLRTRCRFEDTAIVMAVGKLPHQPFERQST